MGLCHGHLSRWDSAMADNYGKIKPGTLTTEDISPSMFSGSQYLSRRCEFAHCRTNNPNLRLQNESCIVHGVLWMGVQLDQGCGVTILGSFRQ